MSEKIYSFLLRFYPARFRHRFQNEALQLVRDRLREEQGFLPKLRLWVELLLDLISGFSRAHRNTYVVGAVATVAPHPSRIPAFQTLEPSRLPPFPIFLGSALSSLSLAFVLFVMNHFAASPASLRVQRLHGVSGGALANPDIQAIAEKLEEQSEAAGRQQACFISKLQQHPGNIGYIKLDWFADPAACGKTIDAVMSRLGETDAVIFDLRDARGGYPEMVRHVAGWFFERPVAWYNPRATSPAQQLTEPPSSGALTRQPVFVLTSSKTFSGAEHFAYNLQKLQRAVLIGETTSGASHAAPGFRPSPHVANEPRPVWEGSGVHPDIQVRAAGALAVAEKLAQQAIQKK